MPEASVEIITARRLAPGCTLVKLDSDITRPSTKDSSYETSCVDVVRVYHMCKHTARQNCFCDVKILFGGMRMYTVQELSTNYMWLRGVCEENPIKATGIIYKWV